MHVYSADHSRIGNDLINKGSVKGFNSIKIDVCLVFFFFFFFSLIVYRLFFSSGSSCSPRNGIKHHIRHPHSCGGIHLHWRLPCQGQVRSRCRALGCSWDLWTRTPRHRLPKCTRRQRRTESFHLYDSSSSSSSSRNPDPGTYLNDVNGECARELFFNKSTLSDLTINLTDSEAAEHHVWAHKAVFAARCEVLHTMLSSGFSEQGSVGHDYYYYYFF